MFVNGCCSLLSIDQSHSMKTKVTTTLSVLEIKGNKYVYRNASSAHTVEARFIWNYDNVLSANIETNHLSLDSVNNSFNVMLALHKQITCSKYFAFCFLRLVWKHMYSVKSKLSCFGRQDYLCFIIIVVAGTHSSLA